MSSRNTTRLEKARHKYLGSTDPYHQWIVQQLDECMKKCKVLREVDEMAKEYYKQLRYTSKLIAYMYCRYGKVINGKRTHILIEGTQPLKDPRADMLEEALIRLDDLKLKASVMLSNKVFPRAKERSCHWLSNEQYMIHWEMVIDMIGLDM